MLAPKSAAYDAYAVDLETTEQHKERKKPAYHVLPKGQLNQYGWAGSL